MWQIVSAACQKRICDRPRTNSSFHSLDARRCLSHRRLSRSTCTLLASNAFTRLISALSCSPCGYARTAERLASRGQQRDAGSCPTSSSCAFATRPFCDGITSRRAAIFLWNAQVSTCVVHGTSACGTDARSCCIMLNGVAAVLLSLSLFLSLSFSLSFSLSLSLSCRWRTQFRAGSTCSTTPVNGAVFVASDVLTKASAMKSANRTSLEVLQAEAWLVSSAGSCGR